MLTHIFLDLDGVLADWNSACIRLFGLDPVRVHQAWPPGTYSISDVIMCSANEMWRRIHAQGAAFWSGLAPYLWCNDLYETCREIAPTTILTSPSRDPSAAAGKTQWLQDRFGHDFRDYLIGPAKASCARPGAVLIDDSDANCQAFEAAGGRALVFPQRWNSAHQSRADWVGEAAEVGLEVEQRAAAYVRGQLMSLSRTSYDGLTKRTGLTCLPALTSLMDELSSSISSSAISVGDIQD